MEARRLGIERGRRALEGWQFIRPGPYFSVGFFWFFFFFSFVHLLGLGLTSGQRPIQPSPAKRLQNNEALLVYIYTIKKLSNDYSLHYHIIKWLYSYFMKFSTIKVRIYTT
jgi:hypothetical protein